MDPSIAHLTAQLWAAAQNGSAPLIASLLAQGANPRAPSPSGRNALLIAAREGNPELLNALLHVSDPHCGNANGETPLMLAANFGNLECAALLLPVSSATQKDKDGWTALMHAAAGGDPRCVELLLPVSNALEADEEGRTALMLAARGHPQCVAALLPASDPLAKNHRGRSALMAALGYAIHEDGTDLEAFSILLPVSDLDAAAVDELASQIGADEGCRVRGAIASERERRALAGVVQAAGAVGAVGAIDACCASPACASPACDLSAPQAGHRAENGAKNNDAEAPKASRTLARAKTAPRL